MGQVRRMTTIALTLLLGAGGCTQGSASVAPGPVEAPEARARVAPSILPNPSPDLGAAPSAKRPSPVFTPPPDETAVLAMLDQLPAPILGRLVDDAGSLERIVRFLLNLGNLLPLQSTTPAAGGHSVHILAYLRGSGKIISFPGLNSPAGELLGYPQTFNRYITYYTNPKGQFDIYRYDLETQTIDTLPTLNTPADELYPTASLGGRRMAYVEVTPQGRRLRLYDDRTHNAFIPGVEQFAQRECITPRISLLGDRVAFSSPVGNQLDIFVYDIERAVDATPPFINSPADDLQPAFSFDETRMLFVSNRRGNFDLYLADLVSGIVEPLVLANSAANDLYPVWLLNGDIMFYSNRSGRYRLYLYNLNTHQLDTLPLQTWLPEGPDLVPALLPPTP